MADKEDKYFVLKQEDISKYLTPDERMQFKRLTDFIKLGRIEDGKKASNKFIVCNQDEPYAEAVWQRILEGENDKLYDGVDDTAHFEERHL